MMARKYSLAEIDTMRSAVRDLMTPWHYHERGFHGTLPKDADVEEQLRTYMANGTTPEEIVEEVRKRHEAGTEAARQWAEEQSSLRSGVWPKGGY